MNRRGFFVMEAILGIVLIVAIAASLAVTLHLRRQVHQKADARQRAVDRAEAALIGMQNSQPASDASVSLERIESTAPAHFRWMRASSVVDGEAVVIVGLVPEEAR